MIDWVFMPSKPLPWDRKDFLKERKHERSESLSLLQDRGLASGFLGVCSPGSADLRRPIGEMNPTGFLMMSVLV